MSGTRGQALRWLPLAGNLALGLLVAFGLGLGALAWRLAQGPLEVPPLARRIEAAANASLAGSRLEIGSAAIAWEDFAAAPPRRSTSCWTMSGCSTPRAPPRWNCRMRR
ncbi:hypothetical protein ACFQU2_30440 [Siccirubricoccus deserti]